MTFTAVLLNVIAPFRGDFRGPSVVFPWPLSRHLPAYGTPCTIQSAAGAGVALGVALALAVTRLMQSLLFGVTPTDPLTFAAVAAGLTLVATVASYLPARKASKVDPMVALRSE